MCRTFQEPPPCRVVHRANYTGFLDFNQVLNIEEEEQQVEQLQTSANAISCFVHHLFV